MTWNGILSPPEFRGAAAAQTRSTPAAFSSSQSMSTKQQRRNQSRNHQATSPPTTAEPPLVVSPPSPQSELNPPGHRTASRHRYGQLSEGDWEVSTARPKMNAASVVGDAREDTKTDENRFHAPPSSSSSHMRTTSMTTTTMSKQLSVASGRRGGVAPKDFRLTGDTILQQPTGEEMVRTTSGDARYEGGGGRYGAAVEDRNTFAHDSVVHMTTTTTAQESSLTSPHSGRGINVQQPEVMSVGVAMVPSTMRQKSSTRRLAMAASDDQPLLAVADREGGNRGGEYAVVSGIHGTIVGTNSTPATAYATKTESSEIQIATRERRAIVITGDTQRWQQEHMADETGDIAATTTMATGTLDYDVSSMTAMTSTFTTLPSKIVQENRRGAQKIGGAPPEIPADATIVEQSEKSISYTYPDSSDPYTVTRVTRKQLTPRVVHEEKRFVGGDDGIRRRMVERQRDELRLLEEKRSSMIYAEDERNDELAISKRIVELQNEIARLEREKHTELCVVRSQLRMEQLERERMEAELHASQHEKNVMQRSLAEMASRSQQLSTATTTTTTKSSKLTGGAPPLSFAGTASESATYAADRSPSPRMLYAKITNAVGDRFLDAAGNNSNLRVKAEYGDQCVFTPDGRVVHHLDVSLTDDHHPSGQVVFDTCFVFPHKEQERYMSFDVIARQKGKPFFVDESVIAKGEVDLHFLEYQYSLPATIGIQLTSPDGDREGIGELALTFADKPDEDSGESESDRHFNIVYSHYFHRETESEITTLEMPQVIGAPPSIAPSTRVAPLPPPARQVQQLTPPESLREESTTLRIPNEGPSAGDYSTRATTTTTTLTTEVRNQHLYKNDDRQVVDHLGGADIESGRPTSTTGDDGAGREITIRRIRRTPQPGSSVLPSTTQQPPPTAEPQQVGGRRYHTETTVTTKMKSSESPGNGSGGEGGRHVTRRHHGQRGGEEEIAECFVTVESASDLWNPHTRGVPLQAYVRVVAGSMTAETLAGSVAKRAIHWNPKSSTFVFPADGKSDRVQFFVYDADDSSNRPVGMAELTLRSLLKTGGDQHACNLELVNAAGDAVNGVLLVAISFSSPKATVLASTAAARNRALLQNYFMKE